ncbi:MAG: uracil-DNA glycosylase [Puniceicoccales bacterium]|jgi:DNA polymerase|nr:uracil-DNA glycosylase [Puniceicoccales bacterium]
MLRDILGLMTQCLNELKNEGVTHLVVEEKNLNALTQAVRAHAKPETTQTPNPAANRATPPPPEIAPTPATTQTTTLPQPPRIELPQEEPHAQLAWLQKRVLTCPTCNEHKRPSKQLVFGTGAINAEIFFCGEAPGAEEETRGEPFVGPAGQLLTKIIEAMGLSREKVYIANIMKWRPELPTPYGDRPPTREEMAFCLPFLHAQLAIIKPKVIVALGATAIEGLLGHDPSRTIGKIHGHWQKFNSIPLMPTYHPSYLLRSKNPQAKRILWEDMLLLMEHIHLPISPRQRNFFLAPQPNINPA